MAMAKFPLWFVYGLKEIYIVQIGKYYFVERPSFISDFVRPA